MARSPKITCNGNNISRVKSFKYLGIHVDDRLNWLEHSNKQGEKAIKMQKNLKRIAGGNWGISQLHRRTLYKTMISHSGTQIFSLVSKSNIQNEEEAFFDSKAIPTPHIGSISRHPNGSVTNNTRHSAPTHTITVRSQIT
ncbi:hypothetical protein AVEN_103115-1 [Araneus ventricosus]|uniref:Reverse transcriptase domain-containing protein n=1 Tax=Araneus ventricosus TaxID=182803 RepID=A0A4Y2HVX8_ARAVE|nr:hypothetical protein AVEN_103115-1 [Araneus ventricosus]